MTTKITVFLLGLCAVCIGAQFGAALFGFDVVGQTVAGVTATVAYLQTTLG